MNDTNETLNPQVGMGATVRCYGDADACTVVEVDDKKGLVTVREDKTAVTGRGAYGSPGYSYEPDPNGREHTFKRDRDGWQEVVLNPETKRWRKIRGYVEFGVRSTYFNPHI